jgi:glucose/arabinose dehydrogenase
MKHPISLTILLGVTIASAGCEREQLAPDVAGRGGANAVSQMGDPFTVGLRTVASGLTSPLGITAADATGRLFIHDQTGKIRVLAADGTLLPLPFLDITSRMVPLSSFYDERGLLGLAFHPDYASNGRFFVYYSAPRRADAPAGYNHTSRISEFHVSSDANRADEGSERVLLEVDKPQSNHNGGTIAFGPDGYLYIAIGDGGGANDTGLGHVSDWYADNGGGNGQDTEANLLGNILRIDVNGAWPYAIPADNPFVGVDDAGRDEIWAYGFRNPYRFAFDMAGELGMLVGDAGQNMWEEVSQVTKGGNYGWNVKEGTHCFDAESPRTVPASCPDVVTSGARAGDRLIDPVVEYANANNQTTSGIGVTVVGGEVARGRALPQLAGRYIFGDWSKTFVGPPTGQLFAATPGGELWRMQKLLINKVDGVDNPDPAQELNNRVLGFGRDPAGDVYVTTTLNVGPTGVTGRVFKLVSPGGKK